MVEGKYYIRLPDKDTIQCVLCPKRCVLTPGIRGFCMARKNENGVLIAESYGKVSSLALDPIEKKPLYRFMPGHTVLSVGSYGCNMNCPFCQNHRIAKSKPLLEDLSVGQLTELAVDLKKARNIGLAYTYNEPVVGYEFVLDASKAIRQAGMKNVLVSNGMILTKPLKELVPFIDAANIDLKCYNRDRYEKAFGGDLDTVKNTITTLFHAGVHLEITMLVVPGLSDDAVEFKEAVAFLKGLSSDIPLHISRYFPARHYHRPPTDMALLQLFREISEQELSHVYPGNV